MQICQLDLLILMPFSLPCAFSITRFNFFCLQVLLTRASLLALAKSIYYQLICRGKTTRLSSEPARWSCDYCQRMSDFDICQFILIRMAYKVLISPRSNVTFNISVHKVCVRVGVRYVITKFFRMDSLPNFLSHGAPLARAYEYD